MDLPFTWGSTLHAAILSLAIPVSAMSLAPKRSASGATDVSDNRKDAENGSVLERLSAEAELNHVRIVLDGIYEGVEVTL